MVSIQDVIFVFDLIKHNRPELPALLHGFFDPLQPFRLFCVLEPEAAVKIPVAAHTPDDPVQGNRANSPISVIKGGLFLLLVFEAFYL
jgi:hypothetical protein